MSMQVLAPTTTVSDRKWSVADLELLPEGYRYEILEGVLYMVALPAWPHSGVIDNLDDILGPWVRSRRLGRVLAPQTGVYLDEHRYLDPDLVFLRRDQIPTAGKRPRAAAIAIEVLSPSNHRPAPRAEREALMASAGVPELWYVDLPTRTLQVLALRGTGYEVVRTFQGAEMVTSEQLPELEFPLTALWEDLGD